MKPLIILSNDDGIGSDGLKVLYRAVEGLGDILIAAPSSQKSGASHALSVIDLIKVKRVKFGRAKAYSVSGTPVDCAKIALLSLAKRKPALLLSGINHGPNIAQFILYSGTIGAAAEAAILGIPSVAFSIDSYTPNEWEFAQRFIRNLTVAMLAKKLPVSGHTLLNVNFPHAGSKSIKGVRVLPRGGIEFVEKYRPVKRTGKKSALYRHFILERKACGSGMSDAGGVECGFVTVTPLDFGLTDGMAMRKLRAKSSLLDKMAKMS